MDVSEKGLVFENFVWQILDSKIEHASKRLNFWRTKDGAEVDFVISAGINIVAFEVKTKRGEKISPGRSLINFKKKYSPQSANIVSMNIKNKTKRDDINIIPYWELF